MKHLKEYDGKEHTVIAIQVENETGLQGAAREHSALADLFFEEPVPEGLLSYLRSHLENMAEDVRQSVMSGAKKETWQQVFGDVAEEAFSAYYVATYVNRVAEAGKREYSLPMFVNCWLEQGKPGVYPSGGPVERMMEVWKYAAPAIDAYAPDIYVRDFLDVCDHYTKLDNPLMIPETASHCYAGSRLVYVIGHYHALCFSPFGIEEMGEPFTDEQSRLFGMDVTDPLLQTPQNVKEYRWYNQTLASMMDLLTAAYGTDRLDALTIERPEEYLEFGTFGFRADFRNPAFSKQDGVLLALKEQEDCFNLLANHCVIEPYATVKQHLELLALEEGRFEDGRWVMRRRLNGDEAVTIRADRPKLYRIWLHAFDDECE